MASSIDLTGGFDPAADTDRKHAAIQAAAKQKMAQEEADTNDTGDTVLGTAGGIIGGIIGAYFGGPAGASAGWSAGQHVGKGVSEMATNRGDEAVNDLSGGVLGALGITGKKKKANGVIDETTGGGDEVPDSSTDTGAVEGMA